MYRAASWILALLSSSAAFAQFDFAKNELQVLLLDLKEEPSPAEAMGRIDESIERLLQRRIGDAEIQRMLALRSERCARAAAACALRAPLAKLLCSDGREENANAPALWNSYFQAASGSTVVTTLDSCAPARSQGRLRASIRYARFLAQSKDRATELEAFSKQFARLVPGREKRASLTDLLQLIEDLEGETPLPLRAVNQLALAGASWMNAGELAALTEGEQARWLSTIGRLLAFSGAAAILSEKTAALKKTGELKLLLVRYSCFTWRYRGQGAKCGEEWQSLLREAAPNSRASLLVETEIAGDELEAGRASQARAKSEAALKRAESGDAKFLIPWLTSILAQAQIDLGDISAAESAIAAYERALGAKTEIRPWDILRLELLKARALRERGRHDAALAAANKLLLDARTRVRGVTDAALLGHLELIYLHALKGEVRGAEAARADLALMLAEMPVLGFLSHLSAAAVKRARGESYVADLKAAQASVGTEAQPIQAFKRFEMQFENAKKERQKVSEES